MFCHLGLHTGRAWCNTSFTSLAILGHQYVPCINSKVLSCLDVPCLLSYVPMMSAFFIDVEVRIAFLLATSTIVCRLSRRVDIWMNYSSKSASSRHVISFRSSALSPLWDIALRAVSFHQLSADKVRNSRAYPAALFCPCCKEINRSLTVIKDLFTHGNKNSIYKSLFLALPNCCSPS